MSHTLDSMQLAVVSAVRPPRSRVFVEGGPGTGKTTTALAAACEVLENSRSDSRRRALVVTFSRSAVAQIENNLRDSWTTVDDRIEIVTLDGLALRIVSGFGRYHGRGIQPPRIQSRASKKVRQVDRSRYQYEELVPLALGMLRQSAKLLNLLRSRWCLVVCDEFQDFTETQRELVELICKDRLLLLGDRNQHIYGWRNVNIEQFTRAKSECGMVFDLGEGSYRDSSLEFPRLASAFRRGSKISHQVAKLANSGRLRIELIPEATVEDAACNLAISESLSSNVGMFAPAHRNGYFSR